MLRSEHLYTGYIGIMLENSDKLAEWQEIISAQLSKCQQALEMSNGEITQADDWLFKNINKLVIGDGTSLNSVIEETLSRLTKLQELNSKAAMTLKEVGVDLDNVKQESISLSPELEQIGKGAFESEELLQIGDFEVSKLVETIASIKIKLDELEVAKNQRQEESKKGFWSRVKGAVGDVLDPSYDLQKRLTEEYIGLAKRLITLSEKINNSKLLIPESTIIKVQKITELKSVSDHRKNSASSTLAETKSAINTLKLAAIKNIRLCTNLAEIEECINEFTDVEFADELLNQASKLKTHLANLERSAERSNSSTQHSSTDVPLADGVLMIAEGRNGQLELLEDRIRIKRQGSFAFLSHGFKGDKEIQIENISAIQFRKAGPVVIGYIQFSFLGSQESKAGIFDAAEDENTITFAQKSQDQFEKIKEKIESIKKTMRTSSTAVPSVDFSCADELEKLASLREKGIITDEEFQAKKRQILGL